MRYILLLLTLFLTGCSSTYQLSSYYSNDPIYGVTQSGDSIRVDVIENEFQFQRKLQWDDKFRWNFSTFAQNQPLSWYYRNFNQLGGWRSPYTPFDVYWNRHLFWSNWSFNYGFTYGYGWNRGIFGLNNWGSWNYPYWGRGYYGYGWDDWRWNNRIDNRYWEDRNRRNIAYVNGRRGSTNNVVVTPNNNSVVVPRLRNNTNTNVRINQGRRIPTPDDVDVVIERPERGIIGRFVDKMENKGIRVRTYQNPNNVPNTRIRNYNRVENNNRSNNNIIIRRNSNSVRQTPTRTAPTRTYSPPPSRSNNTGRSGGGVSVSRGSRGGKIN
jgi:hypothetical protein